MSSSDPMATFKGLTRNDQIFLGAGLLTFIFSFIDFAKLKVTGGGGFGGSGGSISAWHGIGTLAALLILVAVIVAAVNVFAASSMPDLPVTPRFIAIAAAALGFIFFIIRWLTLPSASGFGVSAGFHLAWGGYVTLILNIVMIVVGFLAFKAAGEAFPWENRGGASTPPATPPPAPPAA
jgi:hypothetical protein